MAELADAADSKSADRKVVGVRPPLPALFNYFIINSLQDSMVSCPCGVQMGRCLIVVHLHSGKPSDAGPIQSKLVSVNRKVTAELPTIRPESGTSAGAP